MTTDNLVLEGISTIIFSSDLMFLWISSKFCHWICCIFEAASRDNHRKAPYPITHQRDNWQGCIGVASGGEIPPNRKPKLPPNRKCKQWWFCDFGWFLLKLQTVKTFFFGLHLIYRSNSAPLPVRPFYGLYVIFRRYSALQRVKAFLFAVFWCWTWHF